MNSSNRTKHLMRYKARKALLIASLIAFSFSLSACTGNAIAPASTSGQSQPTRLEVSSESISTRPLRVTLVVDCAPVFNNPDTEQTAKDVVDTLMAQGYCDEDGIMFEEALMIEPGATAFDALLRTNLVVGYRKSSVGPYIYAVSGLSERDGGKTSGWLYLVNGEAPNVSSGSYKLIDGDVLRWRYTIDRDDTLKDIP